MSLMTYFAPSASLPGILPVAHINMEITEFVQNEHLAGIPQLDYESLISGTGLSSKLQNSGAEFLPRSY